MDRAARGDEIFVRRRGRPYVRMLAAIGAASDQAPAADVGSA
jgi:antitoxin (DNA-binding transcriptional repressor) of toxin-antitoxin stability system